MRIKDLPIKKEIASKIAKIEPFSKLNPPQIQAIQSGLFRSENLVISIPTASGKTFIAEMCAIQHILEFGGQVIYLCPLIALASEKFVDFKRFKSLGIKPGISVGEFDSEDRLDSYDLLVSTNEKIDSLIRHSSKFVSQKVSLVIIDECHLIDDSTRGPTLEALIVKLRILNPKIQILALSATVSNASELAEWLNAKLVQSSWRSVPLKEYYLKLNGDLIGRDRKINNIVILEKSLLKTIVSMSLEDNSQVLVFTNSRKSAETLAKQLKTLCTTYQKESNKKSLLNKIPDLESSKLKDRTSKTLLTLLKSGVSFHHAGLNNHQRSVVESLFKQKLISVIVATPTLAAGINLPAKRVIIANLWRYSSYSGRILPLKIMEYEQMRGRAGRPKYDSYGECFLLAHKDKDEEIILDKYYSSLGAEKIESKLAVRPTLRIQVLGAIASSIISNYAEAKFFIEQSFFGFQFQDFNKLEHILNQVLNDLESFNFIIIENEDIRTTRLGKRVSQLYIDPVTANILIKGLLKSIDSTEALSEFSYIHLFCLVPDVSRIRLRRNDWGKIDELYDEMKHILLSDETVVWKFNIESELEAFKSGLILHDWINEVPLTNILEKYDINPGDFQRLHDLSCWISYSAKELVKELFTILDLQKDLFHLYFGDSAISTKPLLKSLLNTLSGIELRLKEGIKNDILELVSIKGLGRVKARTLAQHGIRSLEILKSISSDDLLAIRGFGPNLIQNIQKQLGSSAVFSSESLQRYCQNKNKIKSKPKKKSLIDFIRQ